MFLVRIYEVHDGDYKKQLNGFSVVTIIIVAYLMLIILLQNFLTFPFWARIFSFVILMFLLTLPFGIAAKAHWEDSRNTIERSPLLSNTPKLIGDHMEEQHEELSHIEATSDDKLPNAEEMNIFQAICTFEFWMLFIAMISGLGSGLVTINNMSQIGQSLGYSNVEIDNLVSLWSMWNFLGRFGGGYVSDYFMHRKGWPRPVVMATTLGIMILGLVIVASGFRGNLYVGPVLVGISYGAHWCLMPTISSEIFGVKHMGTIFNSIAAASPLGSYILSVRVVGYFYDKEANKENNSCFGRHCFMTSFLILAGVATVAFLVGLGLYFKTKRFYKQVVIRRLRHSLK